MTCTILSWTSGTEILFSNYLRPVHAVENVTCTTCTNVYIFIKTLIIDLKHNLNSEFIIDYLIIINIGPLTDSDSVAPMWGWSSGIPTNKC